MNRRISHLIFTLAIILSMLLTGCATTALYSDEEIKAYPPAIQEHIRNGEAAFGMTTLQVRYAWGPPSYINVITPEGGGKIKEEWVYSKLGIVKTRLIFIDGRLSEMTSSDPAVKMR